MNKNLDEKLWIEHLPFWELGDEELQRQLIEALGDEIVAHESLPSLLWRIEKLYADLKPLQHQSQISLELQQKIQFTEKLLHLCQNVALEQMKTISARERIKLFFPHLIAE
jgi:predicted translin family RNA/ssDNA-binding protein